ncbi:MAG: hypothetical protein AVDCRST_MAG23-70, partial [uncultured Sphingosinicella sp.]
GRPATGVSCGNRTADRLHQRLPGRHRSHIHDGAPGDAGARADRRLGGRLFGGSGGGVHDLGRREHRPRQRAESPRPGHRQSRGEDLRSADADLPSVSPRHVSAPRLPGPRRLAPLAPHRLRDGRGCRGRDAAGDDGAV